MRCGGIIRAGCRHALLFWLVLTLAVAVAQGAVFNGSASLATPATQTQPPTWPRLALTESPAPSTRLQLEQSLSANQTLWWANRLIPRAETGIRGPLVQLRTAGSQTRVRAWLDGQDVSANLIRTNHSVTLPLPTGGTTRNTLFWEVQGKGFVRMEARVLSARNFYWQQRGLHNFLLVPPVVGSLWAIGWFIALLRPRYRTRTLRTPGYRNHYGLLWPAYLLAVSLFALFHLAQISPLAWPWLDALLLGTITALALIGGSIDRVPPGYRYIPWLLGLCILLSAVFLPFSWLLGLLALASVLCLHTTWQLTPTPATIVRIGGILAMLIWCLAALLQASPLAISYTGMLILQMSLLTLNGGLLALSFLPHPVPATEPAQAPQPLASTEQLLLPALRHINHELRSPIHGVLGMNALLLESELNSDQREYLLSGDAAAQQILNQMEELRTYTRLISGDFSPQSREANLEDFIHDTVEPFARIAGQRDIEVVTDVLPGTAIQAIFATATVERVLHILLDNSVRATREGVIQVTVRNEDTRSMRIRVDDTGRGLAAETLQRLFAWPRLEAEPGASDEWHIGLPLAHRLIQEAGGQIGASQASERGASVWFVVPYHPVVPKPPANAPSTGLSPLNQQRVLIVDDHPACRKVLENQVKRLGLHPECATSGESALAMLQSHWYFHEPFDWVIIDYRMPEMDGLELLRRIRNTPELSDLGCLLMTGVDYPYVEQKAYEYRVRHVLAKPVNSRELERHLKDSSV